MPGCYSAPIDGGKYAADQNADGTWNVRGVPIFAEHERFGHPFDAAWIAGAVARASEQYSGGYLPPLHVGHHPSLKVERAGWFLLVGSEVRTFAGRDEQVSVAIADLLSVPAAQYERIRRGELPYCSVEVLRENFDDPEIKSLALLEHEAPFFPFPLITVGDEHAQAERLVASSPVVACYSAVGGSAAVFRFDGGSPVATKTKTPPKKVANYMADEMDAHKSAAADALKAFTETLAKLSEMAAKAAEDLGLAGSGGEGEAEAPAEADDMKATAEGPAEAPEEEKKDDKKMAASAPIFALGRAPSGGDVHAHYAAEIARMQAGFDGRLAAIEQRQAADVRARELDVAVDGALSELATYGAADPARREDLRKVLVGHAKKGGAPAVAAYVSATKEHGLQVPPESVSALDALGGNEIDPPEVAAYAARGADAHKEARASWRVWKKTSSARPLDQYLAANVDPSTFIAASAPKKGKGK